MLRGLAQSNHTTARQLTRRGSLEKTAASAMAAHRFCEPLGRQASGGCFSSGLALGLAQMLRGLAQSNHTTARQLTRRGSLEKTAASAMAAHRKNRR
jgi:hypothetical protein